MIKIKLNLPALGKVKVKKGKKGLYAELILNGVVVNTITEFKVGAEQYENKELDVNLKNNDIYLNDNLFAVLPNILKKGLLLTLVNGETSNNPATKDKGIVFLGKKAVGLINKSELPANLFNNRNNFKLSTIEDDSFRIVRYANLHQHTEYSLLDGMIRVKDLAAKAEDVCAITDHGNMSGIIQFYNAMKAEGKTPILGVEAYVETLNGPRKTLKNAQSNDVLGRMFDEETNEGVQSNLAGEHLIMLAKNETGLKNLFKVVSEAENHFKRKPHVVYEDLAKHNEGIIVTSACIGGTLSRAVGECINIKEHYSYIADLIAKHGNDFYTKAEVDMTKPEMEVYVYNHKLQHQFIDKMIELYGDDFYIEIQDHHFEYETKIMEEVKRLARERGVKMVVGVDAHYLNKEDAEIHEMWLCLQTKKKMSSGDRMRFSGDGYYVHNSDEIVELFKDIPEAMDNTLEIADKCRGFELKNEGYHLPEFPVPEGFENNNDYFVKLCQDCFNSKLDKEKRSSKVYQERLKFEIKTILQMGWAGYFLIVQDFIAYARDTNVKDHLDRYFPSNHYDQTAIPDYIIKDFDVYVGPGRGSAAGSLVCYCLGITDIDPIKYDLLFERFLSPDRVSMPDIDSDFEDSLREVVVNYVKYKYGADHVSRIITFGTAAARAVIKDVMRVMEKPVEQAQAIANLVPKKPGITLKAAMEENAELKRLYNTDPEIKKIIDISFKFEGLKKNRGQHACGVLITPGVVTDYMPQCMLKNKQTGLEEPTAQFVMTECEDMGTLKMDFLGLRTLGMAHDAIDMIKKEEALKYFGKEDIKYDDIPIDDADVYEFIEEGNTSAVFQFESSHMSNVIREMYQDLPEKLKNTKDEEKTSLANTCFDKMSAATAIGRPGPQAEIPNFIHNMLNPEDIHYETPMMKNVLDETSGVILYQEQVMSLVKLLAGFSAGQSDTIRKAMGKKKKEIIDEYGDYFLHGNKAMNIKGCVANGINEEDAKQLWDRMGKFCEYAFNKSHAVSYSVHSARTAWLSKYFPAEFFCAVLNSYIKNNDKLQRYIAECDRRSILVKGPSVNASAENFSVVEGTIRFGLGGIKGVGAASRAIVEERNTNGQYTSLKNFLSRIAKYNVSIDAIEALIYAGALDGFGTTRKDMIDSLDSIRDYISFAKNTGGYMGDYMAMCAMVFNGVDKDDVVARSGVEFTQRDLSIYEHQKVGFFISGNPVEQYKDVTKKIKLNTFKELDVFDKDDDTDENDDNYLVPDLLKLKLAGTITSIEILHTKSGGKPFCKFTLEGEDGVITGVCFNKVYEKVKDIIKEYNVVTVNAKVSVDEFGLNAIFSDVEDLGTYKADKKVKAVIVDVSSYEEIEKEGLKFNVTENLKRGNVGLIFFDGDSDKNLDLVGKYKMSVKDIEGICNQFGREKVSIRYE